MMKKRIFTLLLSAAIFCFLVAALFMSNFLASAAGTDFEMLNGASVRVVESENGLRFTASLTKQKYTAAETRGAYYGMFIAPKDYVDDKPFETENLFGDSAVYDWAEMDENGNWIYNGTKTRIINIMYNELKLDEVSDSYLVHGSVTNILENNLAADFVGRAYIAFDDGTYELAAYAGGEIANNSRSMLYVSEKAVKDENSTLSEEEKTMFRNEYISKSWRNITPNVFASAPQSVATDDLACRGSVSTAVYGTVTETAFVSGIENDKFGGFKFYYKAESGKTLNVYSDSEKTDLLFSGSSDKWQEVKFIKTEGGWKLYVGGVFVKDVSATNFNDFGKKVEIAGSNGNLYVSELFVQAAEPVSSISVIGGSADKTYAVAGDTVTLTVNEEVIEAYHSLDYWTVNGEKIEGNTFVMPEEAVTVAAVYKENREVVTFSDSHVAGGVTTLYFNCSYDFNGPTERHLTMTTEGDVLVNGGKFGTHIETAGWSGALVIVNLSNLDFGATVQFKSGFTFLFENVKYVLEKDFTFFRMTDGWKLGTALVYGGLHTATNQNTVYTEWSNDIGTGMSADQTVRYIGEVTYNGVAMEATSVCTGWPGNIYLNNLNAANNETEKDRIVIEKGTCFLGAGNARYCATKTYEFVFDGTKWEIEEKNTLTVNTEGSTQTKLIFDVSFDLLSKGYQAGDEVELVSGGFEYKNTWNAPKNQPDFTLETLTGKVNEKGQIYFENLSVTLAEGHIVIVKKGTVIKAKTGSDVELSEAYAFRYVSYNPWSRVEITTMTGAEVSAASPNHNVYMTFDKAITVGKADNGALQLEANFVVHDGENYYGQHNNNAISVVRKAGDDYTALIGNVGPTEGNEVIIPAGTLFHANGIMYCTVEMYVINVNGTWNVR